MKGSALTFQLLCVVGIFGLVISTPSAMGLPRYYKFSSQIQNLEAERPKSVSHCLTEFRALEPCSFKLANLRP